MTKEQIQELTLRTSQANHSGLILVLSDMVHIYMSDAIEAYSLGSAEPFEKNVEMARRSTNELISCFDRRDPLGYRVSSILRFVYQKLNNSVLIGAPDELDRCLKIVDNLKVGLEHLHEIDTEGPVMKNTHQVYAGLTYGKGTLNESVQGVDYSTRGYKA